VVVAKRFSPGAIEELTDRAANWLDETGAARIETASGLLVVRDGVGGEVPSGPVANLRWAASSVDIAELLLARAPGGVFTGGELAERSGWSHAQVTKVLRQFSSRGWVQKSGGSRGVGSGWRIARSDELLDAWTDHLIANPPKTVLAHRVLRDPMQFVRRELARALAAEKMEWALSGWAGSELAAPLISAVPVIHVGIEEDALFDGRLRQLMRALRLREVDDGARVEFRALSSLALSLTVKRHNLPVVSPPRLYADLRSLGGRAEQAADNVRETLLHV
jgi:hypothetical protein